MTAGKNTAALMEGIGGALPGAVLGAFALPFNLLEAGRAREFQKSAMEAQLAAGNFAAQQDAANKLQALWSQAGENMAARNASIGYGADLDLGRQTESARRTLGEFAEKQAGIDYDRAKRLQNLEINPESREKIFQNFLNYTRQKKADAATSPMALALGQTAFTRPFA